LRSQARGSGLLVDYISISDFADAPAFDDVAFGPMLQSAGLGDVRRDNAKSAVDGVVVSSSPTLHATWRLRSSSYSCAFAPF